MATSTLKILREINDYTQEYVAEDILGISQSTYARLEQDPSKISAAHAQRLCDLYNVSLANLLSEATPIITFRDSIKENEKNGNVGYQHHNSGTNNFYDGDVKLLREQNEILLKQNAELMELVKVLGGKLNGNM
ncbi:helix-turn-helix domain-containing protein [Filimonas effusa]|uniref:XRE family transcriptional regulator n=1 Tax=Filimonas effusa TaxID=2508721 RepID=A0A4Q1DEG5_9BACT|nr:helix-turn-helix transcriptional regulator [Filimonas effusa]RXK86999.1 XRE family transcriptional regulator [Filimonas effusa]